MSRILILCTGNSCRSQMAEGFMRSFDPSLEVFSAGTHPAPQVHPRAIQAMAEVGIDISTHRPKLVDEFIKEPFDHVITVCDHAREACPVFIGRVGKQVHFGFDDPAGAVGTDERVMAEFRRVRDEIRERLFEYYRSEVRPLRS